MDLKKIKSAAKIMADAGGHIMTMSTADVADLVALVERQEEELRGARFAADSHLNTVKAQAAVIAGGNGAGPDAHAELRRLAEVAEGAKFQTEGFEQIVGTGTFYGGLIMHENGETIVAQQVLEPWASFIAAANPARIIGLLDELRDVRSLLGVARKDIGLQALVIQSKMAQVTQAEAALAAAQAPASGAPDLPKLAEAVENLLDRLDPFDYPDERKAIAAALAQGAPAPPASAPVGDIPTWQQRRIEARLDSREEYMQEEIDALRAALAVKVEAQQAGVPEAWPTTQMINAGFNAGMYGKIGSGFRAMLAVAPKTSTVELADCGNCGSQITVPVEQFAAPLPPVVARKALDWQPIATAPKDGTTVMLYAPATTYEGKPVEQRVTVGHWEQWTKTASEYHATTGEYLGQSEQDGGASWFTWDGGFTEENPPFQWAPMPDAPVERHLMGESK